MAHSLTCVSKVYHGVIDDVISGVREFFLDEGLDEQVLNELRQLWEQKLYRSNVIENENNPSSNSSSGHHHNQQSQQQQQQQAAPQAPAPVVTNLVPVQITVPAVQAGGVPKSITIHVPSTALANGVAGQQLQAILSSPNAASTFALEASRAAEIIQSKLNQALEENGITLPPQLQQYNHVNSTQVLQVDGAADDPIEPISFPSTSQMPRQSSSSQTRATTSTQPIEASVSMDTKLLDSIVYQRLKQTQVDGTYGTGDSSSEISDDDDDDDDDKDDEDDKKSLDGEEEDDDADGPEDEPLNSEDDVTEDENTDMFDTENVVVCQYDKITRVRNKWKFNLKDGIMNLKGKDYVFQKAVGEGEW